MLSCNLLQLNNLELAVNLAKRGNLPGAENLVSICFSEIVNLYKLSAYGISIIFLLM